MPAGLLDPPPLTHYYVHSTFKIPLSGMRSAQREAGQAWWCVSKALIAAHTLNYAVRRGDPMPPNMIPQRGKDFHGGAYPITCVCFVWIARMHEGSLQFIKVKWYNLTHNSVCFCAFKLGNDCPNSWLDTGLPSSGRLLGHYCHLVLQKITLFRWATITWRYTILPTCHLEGARNRSGRLGVGGGPDLLDACAPCIVIKAVKCRRGANHGRDAEKNRLPRWQAAAVVSKKVLGIQ